MRKSFILIIIGVLLFNFTGLAGSENNVSLNLSETIEPFSEQPFYINFGSNSYCYEEDVKKYCLSGKIPLDSSGKFACQLQGGFGYTKYYDSINIEVYENDLLFNDFLGGESFSMYAYTNTCDFLYFSSNDYDRCGYVSDSITKQSGGTEGNQIEIFARASGDDISTSESYINNIYVYSPGECKCFSGACCDNSSRPYELKLSGSQPTGYTDSYFCSGTNSPIGTSYTNKRDYYCSGSSTSALYKDSTKETCGICAYCKEGYSSCFFYYQGEKCGTKDCDDLDTACRDYHDVDRKCTGGGTCSDPSCNSYTDNPKHTSCGTGKECDGSGTCLTCTSHSYSTCYNNDVYWYDACDNRQEISKECGESYCGNWFADTCHGNDVYETQTCYDKGCREGGVISLNCYIDTYENERYIETCQWGCTVGHCNPNPNVECYSDSDCPRIYSNPYCYDDDVKKEYTDYRCENPGTEQSYCKDIYQSSIYYDCGEDSYSNNYCYDNDVYRDFIDKGCSGGSCFETTNRQKVQECGVDGCSNSQCNPPSCTNDCSSGQTRCSGNVKQTCGNYDADSCLEWPSSANGTGNENCGKASYCSSSTCNSCFLGTANCNENPLDVCEINILTDNNNCGLCGNVCGTGKSCQNGNCIQKLQGDVNGDCKVDILDLAKIGLCYNKDAAGTCAIADLSGNSKVDIFDLAEVGINYGKSC